MMMMMKQLNKLQTVLYILGGCLLVAGAGCFAAMFFRPFACWLFLLGAVLFTAMQAQQRYLGTDITIRRLKRLQTFSGLLFVVSGMLMTDNVSGWARALVANQETYIQLIYNKWVLLLLIAALLQLYTTHRIDHELKKNSKNT